MLKLSETVPDGAIIAQLRSAERDSVIAELLDSLIASGSAPPTIRDELLAKILVRERGSSTALGMGVAIPHVRYRGVQRMQLAIGLSARGIEFSALDKQPVYTVFLLLSPEEPIEAHLKAMELIFKHLSKDTFRRFLRQCGTISDVRALLENADSQHLVG